MVASKTPPEPKTPRPLWLILAALAVVLAFLAVGVSALVGEKPGPGGAPSTTAIGGPFRLEAGGGRIVTDADLRGAPFLVFFGYTHCPDVCPTTLFQLSEILRNLGPEAKIKVLFITVDPERDTPELMQHYAESFDPRIIGLSGDRASIDSVIAAYRVYARKAPGANGEYTMDHSAVIYLMDRDGKFLRAFNLERAPEQAAAELKPLL
ncbi:SCO family protein [Rhodoblastus sp.]|uniref:SCO family protein n=1 Tax=Rhodoblastus sp. TaxID=1962975 RepID=UPI003F94781F